MSKLYTGNYSKINTAFACAASVCAQSPQAYVSGITASFPLYHMNT